MNCDDFLATLPSLFFPNMVARSGDDQDPAVGIEAFRPEHRKALTKTVNSKDKVDKVGSPGRFHSSGHQGDSPLRSPGRFRSSRGHRLQLL